MLSTLIFLSFQDPWWITCQPGRKFISTTGVDLASAWLLQPGVTRAKSRSMRWQHDFMLREPAVGFFFNCPSVVYAAITEIPTERSIKHLLWTMNTTLNETHSSNAVPSFHSNTADSWAGGGSLFCMHFVWLWVNKAGSRQCFWLAGLVSCMLGCGPHIPLLLPGHAVELSRNHSGGGKAEFCMVSACATVLKRKRLELKHTWKHSLPVPGAAVCAWDYGSG